MSLRQQRPPKIVGLTGGQASGKTAALAAFARAGAEVLSADQVVHGLYGEPAVVAQFLKRWGEDVKGSDGQIDRAAVAQRVFSSPPDRIWLEQLLWPLVGQRIDQWIKQQRQSRCANLAVVEVPLLFEAGMEGIFDLVVVVATAETERKLRAKERGGAAVEEKDRRQLSSEEKISRADVVVSNNGTLEDLENEVKRLVERFREQ